MIDRARVFTSRAAALRDRHSAPAVDLSAALAVIHRSLRYLPDRADSTLPRSANRSGRSAVEKFVFSNTAEQHSAEIRKPVNKAVNTASLPSDIGAATKANGGKSVLPLNVLDPNSQTPLQRLLLKAVKELTPAQLAASPALLTAVSAGFQTQGGRQLALAANILDASLVGDLRQPVAAAGGTQARRRLTEINASNNINAAFAFDASIPAEQVQRTRDLLIAITENSPTMRNILAEARGNNLDVPMRVVVDPEMSGAAMISGITGVITLQSMEDAEQAASSIVFEANNAAIFHLYDDLRETDVFLNGGNFLPGYANKLDEQAANIFQGALRKNPKLMADFVDERLTQPDIRSDIDSEVAIHSHGDVRADAEFRQRVTAAWKGKIVYDAIDDAASLRPYLAQKYEEQQLRLATHLAMRTEDIETESLFNHHAIFKEINLRSLRHALTPGSEVLLNTPSLQAMDTYRGMAPSSRGGMPITEDVARAAVIETQVRSGHTLQYLQQSLRLNESPAIFQPNAEPGNTSPLQFADSQADALLEEASALAGRKSRSVIDSAISADGAGSAAANGAVQAAAQASLREQSTALAQKIMMHPKVSAALRAGGKTLSAAAVAAMVYQLGEAIATDAKNGDHDAHATRKVLTELLSGLLVGEAGALGGATVGAIIGSVVPGIGTAIGAFIGGLFGGALGFAVGSAAGSAAYGFTQKPIDALIDSLLADKNPPTPGLLGKVRAEPQKNAALIVQAGSKNDAQINAGELRAGLQAFSYTVGANDGELKRMIDAYSAGNGALSAAELAAAIRDKALVWAEDGSVTVDPYQYSINLGSGLGDQNAQAGHIASRLINLDTAKHDGAGDGRVNAGELIGSLETAGYKLAEGTSKQLLARALNAYDRLGNGAVNHQDLMNAITDGAIVINTDGSVSVNEGRILGQLGGQSANIASRIIQAGSNNDLFANRGELEDGFKAADYDAKLSQAEREILIARYGRLGVGAIGVGGLKKAINDGALMVHASGEITFDRAFDKGTATLP